MRYALLALVILSGCGPSGTYRLHWSIDCTPADSAKCAVASVQQCANRGINIVEVVAVQGVERTAAQFPCFDPQLGAVGHGPGLTVGEAKLSVTPQAAGGQSLAAKAIEVTVTIPSEGEVVRHVSLPAPVACADGVDNDADGLVDLHDAGCSDTADKTE